MKRGRKGPGRCEQKKKDSAVPNCGTILSTHLSRDLCVVIMIASPLVSYCGRPARPNTLDLQEDIHRGREGGGTTTKNTQQGETGEAPAEKKMMMMQEGLHRTQKKRRQ